MTLIVGIRCHEGVVIGADSAATMGAPLGAPTIQQSMPKLDLLRERAIFGTSGAVGLRQMILEKLDQRWDDIVGQPSLTDARMLMSQEIRNIVAPQIHMASVYKNLVGEAEALGDAICLTMVALPFQDRPVLLSFTPQAASEEADDLPFIAIGSGQPQADPFLAFLRRVLWDNGYPQTVREAAFAVIWTLNHVIEVHPGGVAGAQQIAVLGKESGEWKARKLDIDTFQEHQLHIAGAEEELNKYIYGFEAQ